MTAKMNRIAAWFWPAWTTKPRVDACAVEYARLGDLKHVLADIALRGGVWQVEAPASELQLAIREGRRQLALEILELAEMDPRVLRALLDAPVTTHRRDT